MPRYLLQHEGQMFGSWPDRVTIAFYENLSEEKRFHGPGGEDTTETFIKIIILCRYFLTGCYTPKKPSKTVVEKMACRLEPTPK